MIISNMRVQHMIAFLRMAALEMRRIAKGAEPPLAAQLQHMAQQCDQEANEIAAIEDGLKAA